MIYFFIAPKLPNADVFKEINLQVPLRIFSAENKLIAEFGEKRRVPMKYDEIPFQLIQAVLSSEDEHFFEHCGVDYNGLSRAVYSLATTGTKVQGGSTITMQVARNFFLSREKTYLRKLYEIILAFKIEQKLNKAEILILYLNKIYLGNSAYGVGAAANVYYGRSLQDLTLPQLAMIAGLPKAPSKFNPIAAPDRAQLRRDYVLRRMWEVGFIGWRNYITAVKSPITAIFHGRDIEVYAPYVAEMVRIRIVGRYGDDAYNAGFNVHTTIMAEHQRASNIALQSALLSYDRRHGYRGAQDNVDLPKEISVKNLERSLSAHGVVGPLYPSLVISANEKSADIYIKNHGFIELGLSSISWACVQLSTNLKGKPPQRMTEVFSIGDLIYLYEDKYNKWQLAQLPEAEGALVAITPFDGAVTALNGGFAYFKNKFNRVVSSRRQPGSGFKPFIYSAALEKGYTAASIINDAPVVFDAPGLENTWLPKNYSGKFFGPTRLRVGLTNSRNLVSIRLLRDITVIYAINYAKLFGFRISQMPKNLSLALGSGHATPWDMARAYAVFANGGYRIEPYIIKRIEDAKGNITMQAEPDTVCESCSLTEVIVMNEGESLGFKPAKRIIPTQNAYLMNSLLRDVIRYGTGRKALSLNRTDLAGKTGTTNEQVDAWFNGFNPELVAISWVGFDSPRSLGQYETGGRAALPMWIDFMRVALKDLPDKPLKQPINMVTAKIDSRTGLLADFSTDNAIYEIFRKRYVPEVILAGTSIDSRDNISFQNLSIVDLF